MPILAKYDPDDSGYMFDTEFGGYYRVADMDPLLEGNQIAVDIRDRHIDALKDQVVDKDNEIERLQEALDRLGDAWEQVSTRDKHIAELEATIKELESEALYTPKDRWNALVNLNKYYRQIIAERNKEITELKEENTKLKARCHDDQVLHMEE